MDHNKRNIKITRVIEVNRQLHNVTRVVTGQSEIRITNQYNSLLMELNSACAHTEHNS